MSPALGRSSRDATSSIGSLTLTSRDLTWVVMAASSTGTGHSLDRV